VSEWNLEVVAAFMRAAYGKGTATRSRRTHPVRSASEQEYEIPRRRDSVAQSERA